ncbi:hypothetical protein PR048_013172 [Dryococelus australis]|uniref:PiggyBac transposable element-derived protein domain-containing protein n=1 Tax=Dryococelus australis TaxID=614101 RepID=A0ABQ9HSX6_9NEOP|nr:hypothetical protein PR048_013172 [Dryococelus australis]
MPPWRQTAHTFKLHRTANQQMSMRFVWMNRYTWSFKIYGRKERDYIVSVPTTIVLQLSEKLLDEGTTTVTDNYYSIIEVANKLFEREIHLLGTL